MKRVSLKFLNNIDMKGKLALATPVRAPLPVGPPDPEDKAKLENIAKYLDALDPGLTDSDNWPSILKILNKVQLSSQPASFLNISCQCERPNQAPAARHRRP